MERIPLDIVIVIFSSFKIYFALYNFWYKYLLGHSFYYISSMTPRLVWMVEAPEKQSHPKHSAKPSLLLWHFLLLLISALFSPIFFAGQFSRELNMHKKWAALFETYISLFTRSMILSSFAASSIWKWFVSQIVVTNNNSHSIMADPYPLRKFVGICLRKRSFPIRFSKHFI